jgi:hypothetical protein
LGLVQYCFLSHQLNGHIFIDHIELLPWFYVVILRVTVAFIIRYFLGHLDNVCDTQMRHDTQSEKHRHGGTALHTPCPRNEIILALTLITHKACITWYKYQPSIKSTLPFEGLQHETEPDNFNWFHDFHSNDWCMKQ